MPTHISYKQFLTSINQCQYSPIIHDTIIKCETVYIETNDFPENLQFSNTSCNCYMISYLCQKLYRNYECMLCVKFGFAFTVLWITWINRESSRDQGLRIVQNLLVLFNYYIVF